MSNIKYRSGDFTIAQPVGLLRNESPLLPELNDVLVFHQEFVQRAEFFVRLDYNAINPDISGDPAYLFNESPREDYGGNCVRWTRSWARIPSTYGKAGGTYPFPFPAFDTKLALAARDVVIIPSALQLVREFFLCGIGSALTSWQDIPIIPAFRPYFIQSDPTDISVSAIDKSGKGFVVSDPIGAVPGTFPSLSAYKAMIANGEFLDVRDSSIVNFRGGIYMRERYLVKAL